MNLRSSRVIPLGLAATVLLAGPVALTAPAFADDHGRHGEPGRHGGDDPAGDDHGRHGGHGRDDRAGADPRTGGACTGTSTWTLKAKPDDGAIEAEFEVDSNVAGQTWSWRLTDNGAKVAKGTSTTAGRSGSFTVERTVADRPGTDTIGFRARFGSEVCTGTVTV